MELVAFGVGRVEWRAGVGSWLACVGACGVLGDAPHSQLCAQGRLHAGSGRLPLDLCATKLDSKSALASVCGALHRTLSSWFSFNPLSIFFLKKMFFYIMFKLLTFFYSFICFKLVFTLMSLVLTFSNQVDVALGSCVAFVCARCSSWSLSI